MGSLTESAPLNVLVETRHGIEAIFIDITFAILMAPVTCFTAFVELFEDTTEYPTKTVPPPYKRSSSSHGEPNNHAKSLSNSWTVYLDALSELYYRCRAIPLLVTSFYVLMSIWAPPLAMAMAYGACDRTFYVTTCTLFMPGFWLFIVVYTIYKTAVVRPS